MRIAIGDSDNYLRSFSRYAVEAGHEVIRTNDGNELLALSDHVDAIVTTMRLKVRSSFLVLEAMLHLDYQTPAFVCSGDFGQRHRENLKMLGAVVVDLPCRDLLKRVESVMAVAK